MTKNQLSESLIEAFSQVRLDGYKRSGDDNAQAFARYQDNIRLSESLLPALHYLEIILRNRLNKAVVQVYGQGWLVNLPATLNIDEGNLAKLNNAKFHHQQEKRRAATHDDLVAHMTFGFWANFFHKRYDPSLWQRKHFTATVFPHLERDRRSRHLIKPQLQMIKELRNRIAHHEPIWNWNPGAAAGHRLCLELIGAMSQDALARLHEVDRFAGT